MCMNLAETLNFGKTAAAFFTTQPVVSYQIQNLEEELNLKLFERANRHVALTGCRGGVLQRDEAGRLP